MNTTGAISHLKTIALASMVALLVWLFAEGESLATRTIDLTVTIAADPASDLVIRAADPNFRGVVRVRLEATARMLDAATSAVGEKLTLGPGTPGVPNEPGEQRVVDLREALSSMPELKGLGSSVADVQPRTVVVSVIRLATRELPVRVELAPGVDVPLDGDPTPAATVASVRCPENAIATLADGTVLTAFVSEQQLRKLKGDGPQTVPAVLQLPVGLRSVLPMTIAPETMNVTLRVRSRVETLKLATVPVWFSLPPTEDGGKWTVQIQDKFLSDVTLSGPSEEIQRIRAGQTLVKAMLELSSDDLSKGITSKQATFVGLPASLSVNASSTTVRVKIVQKP